MSRCSMLLADLAFSKLLCVDVLCAAAHEVTKFSFCLLFFFPVKALLQSSASRKTQKKKKKKVSYRAV